MPEDQEGREGGRVDEVLSRGLVAWVDGVRRHARAVLVAVALVTVGLAGYAATHLGINTYFAAVLDDDLPFWEDYNAFGKVFPILDEALLVVIDAETPRRAQDAADALAARLAEQTELFPGVYVPGGGEFFEKHALLYLSVEELQDLSDQLAGVQPILAEISRDRSLRNMANVLRDGIEHARTHPEAVGDMSAVFDSLSIAASAVLEGRPRGHYFSKLHGRYA